jgi:predicted site-specific integrase-resolvase
MEKRLTLQQTADYLGVSKQRVSQFKKQGRLMPKTNEEGKGYYDLEDVKKFKRNPAGRPIGTFKIEG